MGGATSRPRAGAAKTGVSFLVAGSGSCGPRAVVDEGAVGHLLRTRRRRWPAPSTTPQRRTRRPPRRKRPSRGPPLAGRSSSAGSDTMARRTQIRRLGSGDPSGARVPRWSVERILVCRATIGRVCGPDGAPGGQVPQSLTQLVQLRTPHEALGREISWAGGRVRPGDRARAPIRVRTICESGSCPGW